LYFTAIAGQAFSSLRAKTPWRRVKTDIDDRSLQQRASESKSGKKSSKCKKKGPTPFFPPRASKSGFARIKSEEQP
jgi:hypothetical protein